jgi:hypothetical protein
MSKIATCLGTLNFFPHISAVYNFLNTMTATTTTIYDSDKTNIISRRFGSDSPSPFPNLNLSNNSSAYNSPLNLSATDSDDFFYNIPRSARSLSPLSLNNGQFLAAFDQDMTSNFESQQTFANFQPYNTDPVTLPMWTQSGGQGPRVANHLQNMSRTNTHPRSPSYRSIGSQAGPRQLQPVSTRPVASPRKTQNHQTYTRTGPSTGQLPTPTATPTRNTFNTQHNIDVDLLMNHQLLRHTGQHEDDATEMSHSNRPSFSSAGQEPVTPLTAVSDYRDDLRSQHGENQLPDILAWLQSDNDSLFQGVEMTNQQLPKFERTLTDAYGDELYFRQPIQTVPANPSYLMAQPNKQLQDRLQAAAMARSPSNSSNQSTVSHYNQFMPSMGVRRRDPQDADYQVSPRTESDQKTISPKEAMLDYKSENEQPLFTQASSDFNFAVAPAMPKQQYTPTTMAFSMAPWSADMTGSTLTSAPVPTYGAFAHPTIPASYNLAHAQPQQTYGGRRQQDTPEFPAHLTSMESSASESAFPGSSAASSALIAATSPKPIDSAADTGTYSCTYTGCTQRFTTPQKLQKHKRDAHRANPHVTPGVGSGMSTTQLMERNSQTGPHKCERINPTTGKPCNQIFSRPYDLTRHEDTIHNIRKQKVRCALCTEEKTFSRSDALTRHMRVVHPEVDFPGKHRKRGGRE